MVTSRTDSTPWLPRMLGRKERATRLDVLRYRLHLQRGDLHQPSLEDEVGVSVGSAQDGVLEIMSLVRRRQVRWEGPRP